jgi:PAS domain-containing protein
LAVYDGAFVVALLCVALVAALIVDWLYYSVVERTGIYLAAIGMVPVVLTVFQRHERRRRAAWRELQQSEERYKYLFTYNTDNVCSLDPKGKFIAVNPATNGVAVYEAEELIGTNSAKLIVPEDRKRAAGRFCRALRASRRPMR